MAQNQRTRKQREIERALKHAGRQGHFASAGAPGGASVPRDIRALAQAISVRRLGSGTNLHADTRIGPSGHDDFSRSRTMLAKGIPFAELTYNNGESRAPKMAANTAR